MASILPGKKRQKPFSPKKALLAFFWEVERDIFSTESISPIYPVFLLTVATVYTQISVIRNAANKKRDMNGLPSAKPSCKKCRVF